MARLLLNLGVVTSVSVSFLGGMPPRFLLIPTLVAIVLVNAAFSWGRRWRRKHALPGATASGARGPEPSDQDAKPTSLKVRPYFEWPKSKTLRIVIVAVVTLVAVYGWADLYLRGRARGAVEHLKRGSALFNSKEYDAAIAEYREAIRLDPKLSMAYNNLGSALDREHRNSEAIAEYREALRLDPKNFFAHVNLGDDLELGGNSDDALTQYDEAARLKPDSALAHCNVGSVLLKKGAFGEALEELKTAVWLDPKFVNAHNNLAWALLLTGDSQGALAECQKAVEMAPSDPSIRKSCERLRDEIRIHPAKGRNPASTGFL